MPTFSAPWSTSLKVMTALATVILLGTAAIGLATGPRDLWIWTVSMIALPLGLLAGSAFFMIRGYAIVGRELHIQRLGWTTRVDLAGLKGATVDPQAMERSLRTFGNGGLFCFAGRFRNRRLGPYRAWATDPARSVVLTLRDRTLVVTPGEPERFLASVTRLAKP